MRNVTEQEFAALHAEINRDAIEDLRELLGNDPHMLQGELESVEKKIRQVEVQLAELRGYRGLVKTRLEEIEEQQ